jgi:acetyl esterase/lipase
MDHDGRHCRLMSKLILCTWAFGIVCLLFGNMVMAEGKSHEKNFVKYRKSPTVRVIPKLEYAKYKTQNLFLDLYLPLPLGRDRPGVVVIRGGGWKVGDRKRFAHVASALAERGVAAACIEYRTANKATFPAAIQDVKAAVRWMRANAAKYGIDPQAIGTMGGSSGAYMALLAGLTTGVPEFEGDGGNAGISSEIQAVVAMAVPADLLALSADNKLIVGDFLHTTPEQGNQTWRWASPVNHIRPDGPPVLLLHGADDDSVPPKQSTDFADLYRQAGASAEIHILDGAPHAFWNYHPWFDNAMEFAGDFFLTLKRGGKAPVGSSSSAGLTGQLN